MTKTEIIAIANQKGGVGKTTTAVNLATALAAIKKRVLFIDFDPQGNASTGLGIPLAKREKTAYDLMVGELAVEAAVQPSFIPDLDVIPAEVGLSAVDVELANTPDREFILKTALNNYTKPIDYVVIDCPPSLGLLTVNALAAADSILIPLQCEFYALEGLSHLLQTIELVQRNLNDSLEIKGVVLTMYDRRNALTREVEQDVRGVLKDKVYHTVIPRNVRVSEAPSHGKPAIIYDHTCSGSQAYLALVKEMLSKQKMSARSAAA